MTDSVAVLSVADRITANSAFVPGAKLKFYQSETSIPLTVYADAALTVPLGTTVYCDSDSYPVTTFNGSTKTLIYTGATFYKVEITDADDVPLVTMDKVRGALDTSSFSGGGEVQQRVPVVAKSSSFSVSAPDDNGTLFDVNCTGGDAAVTFPSAITAGADFYFGVRHNGTANAVINETVSSQTIRHFGAATDALPLTGRGETVWFASDGANWAADGYAPALINNTPGVIVIADRLSAPPVTPAAGARYLLTSSPSGAWSSFSEHDIVESDGSGAWIRRTPPTDCGWIAYVQDEDLHYARIGSAWEALVQKDMASQADMETGTSLTKIVNPGVQKHHPLHPKAWGVAGLTGNLLAGSGIASLTDTGVGQLGVTLTTAMSSANYPVLVSNFETGSTVCHVAARSAGGFSLSNWTNGSSPSPVDPTTGWNFAVFGDV